MTKKLLLSGVSRWLPAACMATALSLAAASGPAYAQAEPNLAPVIDATVRIVAVSKGRAASGWVLVSSDNVNRAGAAVIVAPLNLVEGSSSIIVYEPKTGKALDAIILQKDSDRNLAFLEVKDIQAAAIPLTLKIPAPGGSVWGTGFNASADKAEDKQAANSTVKRGVVGREFRGPISTEARADMNQIEHDAPMLPGFEGGPLVDACGRAIGINMKSGTTTLPRSDLRIAPGAENVNALRTDEIVAAAGTYGIKLNASADNCNPGGAGNSAPAGDKGPDAQGSKTGASAPTQAAPESSLFANLGDKGPLIALLLLGLMIVGFGVYLLTRRRPATDYARPIPSPGAPSRPVSEVVGEDEGTVLIQDRSPGTAALPAATVKAPEIRLSGRGPNGEPIDLKFDGAALASKPVMLGVGTNADVRIPDNRTEHKVSRLHARLSYDGTHFAIEDNKSLNGTSVSGTALEPHSSKALVNGDTVQLADIALTVSII